MLTGAGSAGFPAAEPLDAPSTDTLFAPLDAATHILLAVSGGPDSVALLHLMAAWRVRRASIVALSVATVDHGLRPQARGEANFVAAMVTALGLPHAVLEWCGPKPTTRLQERAREARYRLLLAHAKQTGASHLATAHTLDDQAETILFRLARGSGPAGLVGMREQVAREGIAHVRPLLDVGKARLVATCRAHGWPFVEDPSNVDPRFARTRWRRLAAELAEEGLTPERLACLSHRLARQEAALDALAAEAAAACRLPDPPGAQAYDAACLMRQPEEIFLRVVARAIGDVVHEAAGATERRLRLARLERFCCRLRSALANHSPFRHTIAGALLWTRSPAKLFIVREQPRRGVREA